MRKSCVAVYVCIALGVSCCVKGHVPFKRNKPEVILEAYQMMKDVHELLEKNHIPYWASHGTLIGAVRNKGFIPWDKDFDIWVPISYEEKFYALTDSFQMLGYEVYNVSNYMKTKYWAQIWPYNERRVPYVDVFFVEEKEDRYQYPKELLNGSWLRDKHPLYVKKSELYPLKRYQFGEIIVFGPHDPMAFIEASYGKDWWNACGKHVLDDADRVPACPMGPLQDRVNV